MKVLLLLRHLIESASWFCTAVSGGRLACSLIVSSRQNNHRQTTEQQPACVQQGALRGGDEVQRAPHFRLR